MKKKIFFSCISKALVPPKKKQQNLARAQYENVLAKQKTRDRLPAQKEYVWDREAVDEKKS